MDILKENEQTPLSVRLFQKIPICMVVHDFETICTSGKVDSRTEFRDGV